MFSSLSENKQTKKKIPAMDLIFNRRVKNTKDTEAILHAFISSRLDGCSSRFTGVNQKSIDRLQTVQHSAAGILTRTKTCDDITPAVASLNRLPARFRTGGKSFLVLFRLFFLPAQHHTGCCFFLSPSKYFVLLYIFLTFNILFWLVL